VVPELASREHLRNIVPVVQAALQNAGVSFADVDAVAVTEGPGLAGALMVGVTYAKALAFALGKPLIAVNHLEGHIHAVLMQAEAMPQVVLQAQPLLALVVSGGHTHLYLARLRDGVWSYNCVGRTVDDAAGEAFDKVAKLLGLGYPGGPWMDSLAAHGNPRAVKFALSQVKNKIYREQENDEERRLKFSFSGIKTAVLRYVDLHKMRDSIAARHAALSAMENPKPVDALPLCDAATLDLIASFQHTVVEDLKRKTFAAAEVFVAGGIVVSGGVAANRELRQRFTEEAKQRGLPVAFPAASLSTDNAVMIAAAAWPRFLMGNFSAEDLNPEPQLALG